MKKKTAITFSVLIILFLATIVGASFYLQWYAIQACGNERGKDLEGSYHYMCGTYPHLNDWLDSLHNNHVLLDTFIVADDHTPLHALYVKSNKPTTKTAVIVHGYTDNSVRMLHIGYMYHHDLGYNILLPDLRYSGKSGGNHLQMGWKDRLDVLRWMDVANTLFKNDTTATQMVVHGISMGGATTICVSGEPQAPYVSCFINDCGYTSVWDEYAKELQEQFRLPAFPLLHTASLLTRLRYGWDFQEASPLQQIRQCRHPMLFIHGANDLYVPTWMGDTLFKAKDGHKEYWRPEGVEHANAYLKFPKEYTQKVKKFLDTHNP